MNNEEVYMGDVLSQDEINEMLKDMPAANKTEERPEKFSRELDAQL